MRNLATLLVLLFAGLLAAAQPAAPDPAFNGGGARSNGTVYTILPVAAGKTLIGGAFTQYDGLPVNKIARLNADGSRDAGFNAGAGSDGYVLTIAQQADGKLLVGGTFTTFNGQPHGSIIRLNPDGSVDAGFNAGTGFDGIVTQMVQQPDGRILVAGGYTSFDGTPRGGLARLQEDGSLDFGFDPSSGADGQVSKMALLNDGTIIISGIFGSYDGTPRGHIARVNANGTLDVSFDPGTGADGNIYAMEAQPDGSIYIGGFLTAYNGTARNLVAHINSDGSLDPSFVPGAFTLPFGMAFVTTVTVDDQGKLLVGGYFSTYAGMSRGNLVRINANGSVDNNFNTATGANNILAAVTLQGDGKILIGGDLTTYNGVAVGRITRLQGGNAVPQVATGSLPPALCAGGIAAVPFTASGIGAGNQFTVQLSDASGSFSSPVVIGTQAGTGSGTITVTIPANSPAGTGYRIRVMASNPAITGTDNGQNIAIGQRPPAVAGSNANLCAGADFPGLALSSPGVTYTWTNDNPAIGLAPSGSGTIPAFTAQNGGSTVLTATIGVVAHGGSACPTTSNAIRLRVQPPATMNGVSDLTACAGATVTQTFSSSVAGTGFQWTSTNPATGIAPSGTGSLAFVAQNNTASPVSSTVAVRPVLNGCPGNPVSFMVTVNRAVGSLSYPAASYCPTGVASPMLTGSTGGTFSSTAGLSINASSGVINLETSMAGTYTVSYAGSGPAGGCGASATTSITVRAAGATVGGVGNRSFCTASIVPPISFGGTASSFNWYNDNTAIGLAASGTGTALPSFIASSTVRSAYITVVPVANAGQCAGKPVTFRIAIVSCATRTGNANGNGNAGVITEAGRKAVTGEATASDAVLAPNPARETTTITVSEAGNYSVQVISLSGAPVSKAQTLSGNRITIGTSGLPAGMYVIQLVNTKTGMSIRKQLVKL